MTLKQWLNEGGSRDQPTNGELIYIGSIIITVAIVCIVAIIAA